jgi:hypothetical protein
MKKYLIALTVIMVSYELHAQEDRVIKGTKHISKELTPQQVIDSLHKKFPNAEAVQYYQAPASNVDNGWAVTQEDKLHGQDAEYYTISFKNEKMKYYALFERDGTLLESKMEETSTELPEAVKTSLKGLSQQYPGYKLVSKTYYKTQNVKKSKEYYEVVAMKGSAKKTIYYSPDGTIVKVKDE